MKQRALIYYFWLVIIGLTSMTCGENTPVEEANISSTDLPLAKENIYNPFRVKKRVISSVTSIKLLRKKNLKMEK